MISDIVSYGYDKSDDERFIDAISLISDYHLYNTVEWVFRELIPEQMEKIRAQGIENSLTAIQELPQKEKELIIEVVELAFLGLNPAAL